MQRRRQQRVDRIGVDSNTRSYVGTVVDRQDDLINTHFLERLCGSMLGRWQCAHNARWWFKAIRTSHIIARHGLLHTSMQPLGTVSVKGRSLWWGEEHAVQRRRRAGRKEARCTHRPLHVPRAVATDQN